MKEENPKQESKKNNQVSCIPTICNICPHCEYEKEGRDSSQCPKKLFHFGKH